jgi:hypothetical protein
MIQLVQESTAEDYGTAIFFILAGIGIFITVFALLNSKRKK